MEDKYLLLLLQLIKNDGNIINFTDTGYDFAQTSRHIRYLKNEGIIEYFNGKLQLTKAGYNEITRLNDKLGRKGSERWISPQSQYFIEQWKEEQIYLPSKD